MKTLLWGIFFGCAGYLGVVIASPDMSFWTEFNMIVTAPFIFVWKTIPWTFGEFGFAAGDAVKAYANTTPDATILLILGMAINMATFFVGCAYYVITFVCFGIWLGGGFKQDPNKKPHTAQEIAEIRAREANGNPEMANLDLMLYGLTTNDEVISAKVQANEIAAALRK